MITFVYKIYDILKNSSLNIDYSQEGKFTCYALGFKKTGNLKEDRRYRYNLIHGAIPKLLYTKLPHPVFNVNPEYTKVVIKTIQYAVTKEIETVKCWLRFEKENINVEL